MYLTSCTRARVGASLLVVVLAVGIGASTGSATVPPSTPAAAVAVDRSTPDGVVRALVAAIAAGDGSAAMGLSAAPAMAERMDVVGWIDWLRFVDPSAPLPGSGSLSQDVNRAAFEGQFAGQLKIVLGGLVDVDRTHGLPVSEGQAATVLAAIDPAKLSDLTLVKSSLLPARYATDSRVGTQLERRAKVFGADEATEVSALVATHGTTYWIGATLLRYGSTWAIQTLTAPFSAPDGGNGSVQRLSEADYDAAMSATGS